MKTLFFYIHHRVDVIFFIFMWVKHNIFQIFQIKMAGMLNFSYLWWGGGGELDIVYIESIIAILNSVPLS